VRHLATRANCRKNDPGRRLPLYRDAPVVCPRCGRVVTRKARQQVYCSTQCRERGKERSRKAFLGQDTGAPPNPPKKVNGFNALQTRKSRSSISLQAPHRVVEPEIFGGRAWRQVTSPDGVVCEVSTLRTRALRDGGAS
jgi:hypothetical protein